MATFEQIQDEIAQMLSIPDEDLTDLQRQAMETYLDELASAEASKVDGFGQFVRLQTAMVDACKEEARRLAAKAKAAESRIGYLKAKYTTVMHQAGIKKLSGNAYTVSIRESEAVAVTAMTDSLPEMYQRKKVTVEPDKVAIKEALKGGIYVPGCCLQTTYSLQIR